MTITDAIQEFGFDCKIRKLSPKTISNYQKQLKYLQRYLNSEFKITEIEDIKSIHIKQFLELKDDQRCKARYINDLLKVFKTFFNYLKKEGYIKEQPTANLKSMKQPKVKILTFNTSEIRRLLNYYNGKSFLDIRNRTMIALFFDTGMRLSEVITMEQNQIHDDFIGPTMAINSKYALVISRYISTCAILHRCRSICTMELHYPKPYGIPYRKYLNYITGRKRLALKKSWSSAIAA